MRQVYETIPDEWLMVGKCVRHTVLQQSDGSLTPHKSEEWFLTFKLPWKRLLYSVNTDDIVRGHPRFIVRFKWRWVISHPQVIKASNCRENG